MVYINCEYIKTAEKNENKESSFPTTKEKWAYCRRRGMGRLCVKTRHFYVLIVIVFLDFFRILLRYRQNNEIRTTTATTTMIAIINMEEMNKMISNYRISDEIKRFIKEYVVLSPLYATFPSH